MVYTNIVPRGSLSSPAYRHATLKTHTARNRNINRAFPSNRQVKQARKQGKKLADKMPIWKRITENCQNPTLEKLPASVPPILDGADKQNEQPTKAP